jgi:hypothetical protein
MIACANGSPPYEISYYTWIFLTKLNALPVYKLTKADYGCWVTLDVIADVILFLASDFARCHWHVDS